MGREEFFIEPLNQRSSAGGEEEEEEGEGRRHVVYRSTAVIRKPAAVNQSVEDFHRGENNKMFWSFLEMGQIKRDELVSA